MKYKVLKKLYLNGGYIESGQILDKDEVKEITDYEALIKAKAIESLTQKKGKDNDTKSE